MNDLPKNIRWTLKSHPEGKATLANFQREEVSVRPLGGYEVLVRTLYLSLDPYHRQLMDKPVDRFGVTGAEQAAVLAPIPLGDTLRGAGVGQVVRSTDPRFARGDIVEGYLGYQTHSICKGKGDGTPTVIPLSTEAAAGGDGLTVVQKFDAGDAPLYMRLSALGEQGLTGHIGLVEAGKPRPGETVFVSNAAGSVGQVVSQVAKIMGCRVIGSAGPQHKLNYLREELALDGAVSYRDPEAGAKIDALCPNGIDVYVDLAGGAFSDLVFSRLKFRGRMAVVGTTADWWSDPDDPVNRSPRPWWSINLKQIRVEGFVLWDYVHLYDAYIRQLRNWWSEGKLKSREHMYEGIDAAPQGLLDLFEGRNFGKAIVRVNEPE
ncbi:hypothetical protein B0G71_7987 [Paraburkholderia sp. BL27I4N3]|uniref:MDR family NADP-dependent oxidoreductase n=1 Tax=Paraburkholderia sp. BL27I4N3 TaxID=1938805 RepID=UPI000E21D4C7|nr:NADP-dependent oxidoreductase [Paraburkholderia sp. BL27I4N3]REE07474.1 hypothetical protein B0G71_7987 [Paraburkholderia sp. BL27I4N3]